MDVLGHWLLDGQDKNVRLVMIFSRILVKAPDLKSIIHGVQVPLNSGHLAVVLSR